eukprot:tig00021127_g18710.t1
MGTSTSKDDDAKIAGKEKVTDFSVYDNELRVDLKEYKGKVLLITNVASKCGLTGRDYPQLTELYNQYKDKGLEILAFPCNQFGKQEPWKKDKITVFACSSFKVTFRIFDKIDVNGADADPLWVFLRKKAPGWMTDGIKWNFTKFLVDREGNVVRRYGPNVAAKALAADIQKLL